MFLTWWWWWWYRPNMVECLKCHHRWEPRVEGGRPVKCPSCAQPNWWKVRRYGNVGVDADDAGATTGGSGERAAVPSVRKAKGKAVKLHPVQPVRDELVGGAGHLQAPAHEGHSVYRAGDGRYCSDCKVNF